MPMFVKVSIIIFDGNSKLGKQKNKKNKEKIRK